MDNHAKTVSLPSFSRTYFHGTKADLKTMDLITVGYHSNYDENRKLKHVYVSAILNTAKIGAALAVGEGRERIYLVEATGELEDDPNVTDKKYPGNPTMSYRSVHPFKVVGEVIGWEKKSKEEIDVLKEGIKKLVEQGINYIID
jgi:rifampin ADP-ribosylating transferase